MRFKIDFQRLFGKATDTFFSMGLMGTGTFHDVIRPVLNGHSGRDVRKAQSLAVEGMHSYIHVVRKHSDRFLKAFDQKLSYDTIRVRVAGKEVVPTGTASGLDPDAEALLPFSYLFGFQMPGPVLERPRSVDGMPFQDDGRHGDLFVPPTFSSKGVVYVRDRLREYREAGGNAVILPVVLGLPSRSGDCAVALEALENIVTSLEPFSDGFVWCPYWSGSEALLSEDSFARTGECLSRTAGSKLKLVEMFAFEEEERPVWLRRVRRFLEGGGDGLLAVAGRIAVRSELPHPDAWEHETAIRTGGSLAGYRARAIEAARHEFPGTFIVACGGFHSRDEAFHACEFANVIAENEAYTRYGPGIARVLLKKIVLRLNYLHRQGQIESNQLSVFQRQRWAAL